MTPTAHATRLLRPPSLTTLQLFVAVCESGSIGHAAQREFIAASAVSKRLSDLEREIGMPLLQRHSRGVRPTPAGQSLLQHARSILNEIERLHSDLQEYAEGVRGHVQVFANLSAIVQFLPEDLGHFVRQHPAIKIDLQERMSRDTLAAVQEGAVGLGICHTPGQPPAALQARPYHRDRLVLVMPRSHRLADAGGAPGLAFAQALEADFVGLHSDSSIGLLMRQAAAAAGKALRQRIQVTGLDAMCRMIDNGLGIGLMPDRAFALMQSWGGLCAMPLLDAWAQRQSWLIARDFEALPPAARLLAEHLQRRAQAPPAQA